MIDFQIPYGSSEIDMKAAWQHPDVHFGSKKSQREMNKDDYSLGWRKWCPESMMTSRKGGLLSYPGCRETHLYQASTKTKPHNNFCIVMGLYWMSYDTLYMFAIYLDWFKAFLETSIYLKEMKFIEK